jgi:transposase-like protein
MSKPNSSSQVASDKSETIAALPAACADETLAVEFMERQRWGSTPACPRCGDTAVTQVKGKDGLRNKRYLWRCQGCKQQFTVRIGTIFEESRIPLRHWCYAFWAACASKKGVSAMQIQRTTGLTYKSALYLMHRIRLAMTPDSMNPPKLTGIVESDETYVGGKPRKRTPAARQQLKDMGHRRMPHPKNTKVPVMVLVQRGGTVRAMVVPVVNARNVREILKSNIAASARLMTDESNLYQKVGQEFGDHQTVTHSKYEYARGDVHVNSAENFFSRLKRQLYGTHHCVSKRHLHRYVSEVAFKHNTRHMEDGERVSAAITGSEGKRLRYRAPVATRYPAERFDIWPGA